jgi:hypothetical protein
MFTRLAHIVKTQPIPLQHLDVSKKVMRQTKRLSPLKVGVARNHRAAMQIRLRHKSPLQALKIALQFIQAAP